MLRLCSYFSFACEDCLRPRDPPTHKPFTSVFQPFQSPSHAGAMDEYNSVEGLLAPAREGRIAATERPVPAGAGRRTKVSHVVAPCAWH